MTATEGDTATLAGDDADATVTRRGVAGASTARADAPSRPRDEAERDRKAAEREHRDDPDAKDRDDGQDDGDERSEKDGKDDDPKKDKDGGRKKRWPIVVLIVVAVLVVIGGIVWWFLTRNEEGTDDAYTEGGATVHAGRPGQRGGAARGHALTRQAGLFSVQIRHGSSRPDAKRPGTSRHRARYAGRRVARGSPCRPSGPAPGTPGTPRSR